MRTTSLPLAMASLALVLGATPASAANASIQVHIPFEFVIGNTVLPPARYVIETASGTEPHVLKIRTLATGERVMFDTSQMSAKVDPKTLGLVFETVGDRTYLTEVWGVTDSGRSVKHLVKGRFVAGAPEAR